MKIKQKVIINNLNSGLQSILEDFRKENLFNLKQYLLKKIKLINKYFKENNLDTAVVAVSGGIDSAISLALINLSMQEKKSPIKSIFPVFIPCYSESATNQDTAFEKATLLCHKFNLELVNIKIADNHKHILLNVKESVILNGDAWSDGQLVSYLRTCILYYCTSLLTANNQRPVIIGTTNKDEGAYIGYFGKAADGMVDVQIISDIHKKQVFELGKYFDIPSEILNATPTGDMYDGRKDEEVFGAPYDFVELYFYLKNISKKDLKTKLNSLSEEDLKEYYIMNENIDNMYRYNKHKYYGCSPAVHLDVLKYKTKNGWTYKNYNKKIKNFEYGDHKSW